MIRKPSIEEGIALEKSVSTPKDQKPRFNWRTVLDTTGELNLPHVRIQLDGIERGFDASEVAETVGSALTDLMLARRVDNIFTEHNRAFVANVAAEVARFIRNRAGDRDEALNRREMDQIIEKILIDQNAHDVARAHLARREERYTGSPSESDTVSGQGVRLIRRNHDVVPWDASRIELAVRKAFHAVHLNPDPTSALVAATVTQRVQELGEAFVHIETVQDIVEQELVKVNYRVGKAYMLYRHERARLREESRQSSLADDAGQDTMIMLRREDGEPSEFWNPMDLRRRMEFAVIGLSLNMSLSEIETELRRSLFTEMTRDELRRTIILNAKSLLEKDADFAKFAARILLTYIYEEVLGWDILKDGLPGLKECHRTYFRTCIRRGVELGRYNPELLNFDLDRLADALDPSADLDFDYLGISTLYDRYLIIDKSSRRHRRLETPQIFWMRVSMGLFLRETSDREGWIIRLYNLYKRRLFCSSTPTLFNSGTLHSQLSSCYLYKVDDSIESIMIRGIAENAFLSKWAGGLGGSWTSVRGTGSYIRGTNGESQGVIPFLKLHNDQLVAVNQGGKRKGSGCAYLETWHSDIMEFLELRRNVGDDRRRTHDMNTANWIPDLFMKRMESREDWTLFHSSETPDLHDLYGKAFETRYAEYEAKAARGEIWSRKIKAIDLWKQMLKMLFETGHPWITFKDPCNVRSPQDHVGVVHSSNLCTEITLNTSHDETAVCNLGSVILDTHIDAQGNLDMALLRDTIQTAVRALDNVIDINFYPTEAARVSNLRHRPVGLGIMGLHNALFKKNIPFASSAAVEFNDEFMEAIAYFAYEASSDLAAERGSYSTFRGSKWDRGLMPHDTLELLEAQRGLAIEVPRGGKMDWNTLSQKIKRQGMRNSNVLAIAPTATISNIMGTSPCIEPYYRNFYAKSNLGGDFIVLNPFLVRDLKARQLWNQALIDQIKYFDGELDDISAIPDDLREKYRTAFGIGFEWIIEAAARRQKWIDQSQSLNLFLATPDLKVLSHMYRAAWRVGLKTTYYLRSLGASKIEKSTVSMRKDTRGVTSVPAARLQPEEDTSRLAEAEKAVVACAIDSSARGVECESCQ